MGFILVGQNLRTGLSRVLPASTFRSLRLFDIGWVDLRTTPRYASEGWGAGTGGYCHEGHGREGSFGCLRPRAGWLGGVAMSGDIDRLDSDALRIFVCRLVSHKVFSSEVESDDLAAVASITRQFVLAAAHENGGRFDSCHHCEQLIQERWGVSLEAHEIAKAIDGLQNDDKLMRLATHVELTDVATTEVSRRLLTATELEAGSLAVWEDKIRTSYPALGIAQLGQLREDLISCIHTLITDRGIEAAIVLFPEQARYKHRLEEILALRMNHLPERDPDVAILRRDAIRSFFHFTEPIQRQWFEDLLATSYLMSVLTIEPAAFERVRRLTKGQRIYLDTNILFPLFKLHGEARYSKIKRILTLSRLQGYEVCVAPWTSKEMLNSVRSAREKLKRRKSPPRNDATAELFLSAFRRQHRDLGRSFDEFFDFYEQVPYLLELEGVKIVSDQCEAIDHGKERIGEEIPVLERYRQGDEKPRAVQEHDVKLRLLIEALRVSKTRPPSNVGYVLLTDDHSLVRYAARKEPGENPFAVLFDDWGRRTRSLRSRSDDYEKTMALILESPALRIPQLLTHEQVMRAISQIRVHEEFTPDINARKLLDEPLADDYEVDSGDYERSDVIRTDREAALEAQMRAADEQIGLLREALTRANERISHMARDPTFRDAAVDEDEVTMVETGRPGLDEIFTRRMAARWLAATYCFFLSVIVVVVLIVGGRVHGEWPVVDASGAILLWLSGIAFLRSVRFATGVTALIASVLTIVLALQAFIP
jgi:hypothetical protein